MLSRNFQRGIVFIIGALSLALMVYFSFFYFDSKNNSLVSDTIYTVPQKKKVFLEGEAQSINSEGYQVDPTKGQISVIYVKDKDFIKKGQLLLSYKNEAMIQQYDMMNAQLDTLQQAYDKMKQAYDTTKDSKGSMFTSATVPDLSGQLQGNLQQQEKLKNQITKLASKSYTEVYAPFSGVVSISGTESSPVVSISSNGLHIVCDVSEKDILDLSKGQKVNIRVNSTGQEVKGKIKDISTEIGVKNQASGSNFGFPLSGIDTVKSSDINHYPVYIEFDKGVEVYPGFHVQVSVDSDSEMPKIPVKSVFTEGSRSYVWKIQNGCVVKTPVTTLKWNDKYLKVKSGVTFGDKIIKSPDNSIKEGDRVESESNRD